MKKYIEALKYAFSDLKLNNEHNKDEKRTSHPLELFFDLIFVVSLGTIGHEFLHPTINGVLISLILFLTIYQIWKNITEFNVYFFSKSFYIRILFLFVMLPVLFIVAINDYSVKNNIYLLIISFTFSRFILAFIWRNLIYKNKNIVNKYINKLALIYSNIFIITALIILLGLFNYQNFHLHLILAVVVEFILMIFNKLKLNNDKEWIKPYIDYELLLERRILFMILVWGEGLVIVARVFPDYSSFQEAVEMTLSLFFIIGLFFLRASDSYEDMNLDDKIIRGFMDITDYIFPFAALSLFISLAAVATSVDHISEITKAIIIFDLMYINLWHYLVNIYQKRISKKKNLLDFINLDNIFIYIQTLITILLIFIHNKFLIIGLVAVIFILHALALPLLYKEEKSNNI